MGGGRESKVNRVRQGGEAKPQKPLEQEQVQKTQSSHKGLSLGEVDTG